MSRRKSKKALITKSAEIISQSPEPAQTVIVVSGSTCDGIRISQDIVIKHFLDKQIGEIFWAAIDTVKKIGGLVEEVSDGVSNGINFYPINIFERGLHFSVKQNATKS